MYPLSPLIDGSSFSWVAEPRTQQHVPCVQNTPCTALRLRGVDVHRSERIVWARPDYQVAPIQPDTWVEWCLWGPDVVVWGEKWPKFRTGFLEEFHEISEVSKFHVLFQFQIWNILIFFLGPPWWLRQPTANFWLRRERCTACPTGRAINGAAKEGCHKSG